MFIERRFLRIFRFTRTSLHRNTLFWCSCVLFRFSKNAELVSSLLTNFIFFGLTDK